MEKEINIKPTQEVSLFLTLFGYLPPLKRCRCNNPEYIIADGLQVRMIRELGKKNEGSPWICQNCKGLKFSM